MTLCDENEYESISDVRDEYPAAAMIVRTDNGWAVFDTIIDYKLWCTEQ